MRFFICRLFMPKVKIKKSNKLVSLDHFTITFGIEPNLSFLEILYTLFFEAPLITLRLIFPFLYGLV